MGERVIVLGQSHLRALIDASVAEPSASGGDAAFSFVTSRPQRSVHTVVGPDGPVRQPVTGPVADLLRTWEASRVAIVWGGNQMNTRALVATGPPFDVVLPDADGSVNRIPGAEVVPCSVVVASVRDRLEANEELAGILDAAASLRLPCCVVGPPPPLPERAVRDRLASSPHFAKVLEAMDVGAGEAPLVPDAVRTKLWVLMGRAYRSFADGRQAGYLDAPQASRAGDGSLAEAFWSSDATHANAAYGALVLGQLEGWATEVAA